MKRDKIFYAACGLSVAGILFAALGYDFSFVLFTAAYLLRPVMTECGLGAKFADERERTIHAKSGDVAFIVLIVALAGFALLQISQGKRYISPSLAEKLAGNLEVSLDGPPHETLSDREYQVMCMIASGKTLREIADGLSLSIKTISTYRSRILEKMNMKTNAELTHYAIKNRLVD